MLRTILLGLLLVPPLGGTALGVDNTPVAGKSAATDRASQDGKMTLDQVLAMLESAGLRTRPSRGGDGAIIGYASELERGGRRVTVRFILSKGRTKLWIDARLVSYDPKAPPTSSQVLGVLARQDALWPAYVGCLSESGLMLLSLPIDELSAQGIRSATSLFLDKWDIAAAAVEGVRQNAKAVPQGGAVPAKPAGFLFRSNAGRFQARFPGKPTLEGGDGEAGAPAGFNKPIQLKWDDPTGAVSLNLSFFDLSDKFASMDGHDVLRRIGGDFCRGGSIVSEQCSTFGPRKLPMVDLTVSRAERHTRFVLIRDGARVYIVSAAADNPQELTGKTIRDFLASLQVGTAVSR